MLGTVLFFNPTRDADSSSPAKPQLQKQPAFPNHQVATGGWVPKISVPTPALNLRQLGLMSLEQNKSPWENHPLDFGNFPSFIG